MVVLVFSSSELDTNTEIAVEIAKQLQCSVHFLYIKRCHDIHPLKRARDLFSKQKWNSTHIDSAFPDLQKRRLMKLYSSISFQTGKPNENMHHFIINYCNKHNIDLVLFLENMASSLRSKGKKLNIISLSDKLNCPVLRFNYKSNKLNIQDIIIPVGKSLPLKILIAGSYIGRVFQSKIHLISLPKKFLVNGHEEALCQYKAYHLLHDNTNLEVECITLMSKNIEEAALRYAIEINADIVFLNSNKECINKDPVSIY